MNEFHSRGMAWTGDRVRQNFLISAGWRVLRFTWDDVKDPSRFIEALSALLVKAEVVRPRGRAR